MKKITLLLLALGIFTLVTAAELKLLEFRELSNDLTAQTPAIFDIENNYCAALRVELVKAVPLTFSEKIYKTQQTSRGDYYYFSAKEKGLTLKSPGYKDLYIPAPATGFKGTQVYYARIEAVGEPSFDVTIQVMPPDAVVLVNGKPWTTPTQKLTPGEYSVEISKEGYDPLRQKISVGTTPASFNFNLSKTVIVEKVVPVPPVSPTPSVKEEPKSVTAGLPAFEAYDFSFKMLSCQATPDNKLIIKIQITNHSDEDRDFYFKPGTRIFDEKGKEYRVAIREIGDKKAYSYQSMDHQLVMGVPTVLILTFEKIPPSVNTIAKLELEMGEWSLPFRNFPIAR